MRALLSVLILCLSPAVFAQDLICSTSTEPGVEILDGDAKPLGPGTSLIVYPTGVGILIPPNEARSILFTSKGWMGAKVNLQTGKVDFERAAPGSVGQGLIRVTSREVKGKGLLTLSRTSAGGTGEISIEVSLLDDKVYALHREQDLISTQVTLPGGGVLVNSVNANLSHEKFTEEKARIAALPKDAKKAAEDALWYSIGRRMLLTVPQAKVPAGTRWKRTDCGQATQEGLPRQATPADIVAPQPPAQQPAGPTRPGG